MNKFTRTLIIAIPVVTLIVTGVFNLVATGTRTLIYWAFNRSNYWDVSNEWFQIMQDLEVMYCYWQFGD